MMKTSCSLTLTLVLLATAAPVGSPRASEPTPTPTPASTPSLAEASKRAREAQGQDEIGKKEKIVISDENLEEYAAEGALTETTRPARRPESSRRSVHASGGESGGGFPGETPEMAEKRRYWQGLYQRQLELIASLEHQIEVLDETIPLLWRKFYAWDDPAYRDGVIKPELDQALARRDSLEERLTEARGGLGGIIEGARRDGGQPGWFRGLEVRTPPVTPTPDPATGPGTADVRDVDDIGGGGG